MRRSWMPLLLLAACAGEPAADAGEPAPAPHPEPGTSTFAWVWLHAGEQEGSVTGAALEEAQAGHFANMARLAEEQKLVLAGPLWEPRAEDSHRGVFLFARGTLGEARELSETDPAVQAGLLRMQVEPFICTAPLEEIGPRHEAAVAASGVEDPPPGFLCQGYVILMGLPATAAREAMEGSELPVLFEGPIGNWAMTRQLYCLDLRSVDELPAELPGGDSVIWTVAPWFSTEQVASLAGG